MQCHSGRGRYLGWVAQHQWERWSERIAGVRCQWHSASPGRPSWAARHSLLPNIRALARSGAVLLGCHRAQLVGRWALRLLLIAHRPWAHDWGRERSGTRTLKPVPRIASLWRRSPPGTWTKPLGHGKLRSLQSVVRAPPSLAPNGQCKPGLHPPPCTCGDFLALRAETQIDADPRPDDGGC